MLKILRFIPKFSTKYHINASQSLRTFLSQAYHCQEVWDQRLLSPLFQKINASNFYDELEQRYQSTKQISAVDVDIFANSEDVLPDELLDIVHKFRLTADTCNTLNSTSHAVVRNLLKFNKAEELLNALDDRLNYGLFLDYYTANLLLDIFWKNKEYAHGARVASQLMIQEEFGHPLSCAFSLLHCYNYLKNPEGWPEYVPPPEPEEVVKIRVKYVRNPYDDEHFDLKDSKKIVGKTLALISKNKLDNPLYASFYILGMALFGKIEKVRTVLEKINFPLYKDILDLIPDDNPVKESVNALPTETSNVSELLVDKVKKSYQATSERDITDQYNIYKKWETERVDAMEAQKLRLSTARRLKNIEDLQKSIKDTEEKLWFFSKEEEIDLEIERKEQLLPAEDEKSSKSLAKAKAADDSYIPPEIEKSYNRTN